MALVLVASIRPSFNRDFRVTRKVPLEILIQNNFSKTSSTMTAESRYTMVPKSEWIIVARLAQTGNGDIQFDINKMEWTIANVHCGQATLLGNCSQKK